MYYVIQEVFDSGAVTAKIVQSETKLNVGCERFETFDRYIDGGFKTKKKAKLFFDEMMDDM